MKIRNELAHARLDLERAIKTNTGVRFRKLTKISLLFMTKWYNWAGDKFIVWLVVMTCAKVKRG